MSWWAIMTTGGRVDAFVNCEDKPCAAATGNDMRGRIAVPIERPPEGPWEQIGPDGVWTVDVGLFVACAEARIHATYEERCLAATGPLSDAVRYEYQSKLAEARAVLEGAAPGPFLTAEAAATGVAVEALAALIVERAAAMNGALARHAADRRAAIQAVQSADGLEAKRAALEAYLGAAA